MSTEVPGQPWEQSSAPTPESAPKVPRQKRKARAAAAPAEPEPAKARKPREPKAEPDTIKIGIKEYAEMRVTAFQREFVKLHKILAPIPAKARTQIIAELEKVFG